MLCDFHSNKKVKVKQADQKKKIGVNYKLIFITTLILLVTFLLILAIQLELKNIYQLKENERILLIKNKRPVAILFFNVNNKQLVVTDLRQKNFDLSIIENEATLSSSVKKNLVYSFLLDTVFDQSYEYPSNNLDRENLATFFKNQKIYSLFLKDKELLWKEQDFEQNNPQLVEPMFNCSVALVNTTNEIGLANSLASIFEKSAFSIIKKDNNTENLTQTKIVYDPGEKSCVSALSKLSKIMPESLIVADREEAFSHRAALVIYIGRDLADLYVFFINLLHSQI